MYFYISVWVAIQALHTRGNIDYPRAPPPQPARMYFMKQAEPIFKQSTNYEPWRVSEHFAVCSRVLESKGEGLCSHKLR